MNRAKLALLPGLLAACTMMGPQEVSISEVGLYGNATERLTWVYGQGGGTLNYGGQALRLSGTPQGPLALPGTLGVNGEAVLRERTVSGDAPANVSRLAGGGFVVQANGPVQAVFYTPGSGSWLRLTGPLRAGENRQVRGENVAGITAPELLPAEAELLSRRLAAQGPLAVVVYPPSALPEGARDAGGATVRRTALYVQANPPATGLTLPGTGAAAPLPLGNVTARTVAQGQHAAHTAAQPRAVLAANAAALAPLWREAQGAVTPTPPVPALRGVGVLVFLGQRPTGGYALALRSASFEAGELRVVVEVTAPPPDALVTQVITSPWLLADVETPGPVTRVVVLDTQGRELARR